MAKQMSIEHYLVLDAFELVVCDGHRYFVVDRTREELRSLLDPCEVLPLAQRQFGRLPDGKLEVLERYESVDASGEPVVLDSSPSWLDQLPRLKSESC